MPSTGGLDHVWLTPPVARTRPAGQSSGVGDEAVRVLVERCPSLAKLYLNSTSVSDGGLS